jgi:hypothetical protein
MSLQIVFNPFTGKFDYINSTSGSVNIPEVNIDPLTPNAGDTWVLHLGTAIGGSPIGLLLALTQSDDRVGGYDLSYRTSEGTTVRTPLTQI